MDLAKLIDEVYESSEETKREENAKIIAGDITSGGHKLVEVVEALGSRLTSTQVQDRVTGMSLLGHILENLKRDFLNEQELTFIVEFLHDRLKDQHLVIPKVIHSILPVVQCANLPDGSSVKLLRQLFQEANIQSHTQRNRRVFFLILQHLIRDKTNEIKELGTDFVMSFLQAMDGEKDPRNLLLLFNLIPLILVNFPLGPFVEDFFEVLSMYFPIDFNPTLGGPDAEVTTRSELAKSLHICLSQTNQFSEYLIPLALEKLESSVVDAKLDSLNLLEMCCERSYTAEDLGPHLPPIWHALRREIFMGGNEEVEKAANSFIQAAFKRLSENEELLETALKLIFAECKHHLSEPELRLSQPASKILCSAAGGSSISCSRVVSLTLPLLYDQFTTKTSNPERRGILGIMIQMMDAIRPFPSLSMSVLLANWDEILWMWFSLLTHSHDQFVLLSLLAFHSLLENGKERRKSLGDAYQYNDFDEKNRDLLQAHLLSLLSKDDILPEITSRVLSTMGLIGKEFPDEFLRTSTPKLLGLIEVPIPKPPQANSNRSESGMNNEISEAKMKNYLASLALCSSSLPVGKVVIPKLIEVIVELKERNEDYDPLVGCLSTIIEEVSVGPEGKSFIDFVSRHLALIIKVGLDARSERNTPLYARIVGIIRALIQNSDASRQQELMDGFWNELLTKIKLEDLVLTNALPGLLAEGILGSVRPSIHIAKKNELMKLLLEKVFSEPLRRKNDGIDKAGGCVRNETAEDLDTLANIRLLSTFLNKADEKEFPSWLAQVETFLGDRLPFSEDSSASFGVDGERVSPAEEAMSLNVGSDQSDIVTFFIWTVKALAMRGYPDLHIWIQNKMIRLLNNSVYGNLVADGFSVLMSDSPESLNAKSFCNYRFLYKQRIFQLSIPKLVEGYRAAYGETKANFIRALTGQLRHVPQALLQMELNNVVPLLVGSLDYELPSEDEKEAIIISRNASNAPLLISSLTALLELLTPFGSPASGTQEKASPLLDYFMDLTPRLLRLAQYKGFMQVRVLALKCLQRCARFPSLMMLPIKEQVVRDLQVCLDDPKRFVRKEAVLCRNIWTLTGSPGGL